MSKAKLFKDHHDPIKIELEDLGGEVNNLSSVFLTAKEMADIELIGYQIVNPDSKKEWERTEMGKLCKMMSCFFGKDEKFWLNFSPRLLNDVLDYILEENKKKASK